jgi:hypothetical protein
MTSLIVHTDEETRRAFDEANQSPIFQAKLEWVMGMVTTLRGVGHNVHISVNKDYPGFIATIRNGVESQAPEFFCFLVPGKFQGQWDILPYIHGHPLTPSTSF